MDRNTLDRIKEIKGRRSGEALLSYYALTGLESILAAYKSNEVSSLEALVVLVRNMEVFTRTWLSELIDKHVTKPTALKDLIDDKIGKEILGELHTNAITLGELVSLSTKVSKFQSIFTALNIGCGGGLKEKLSALMPIEDLRGKVDSPYISDWSDLEQKLIRSFNARHVIVHELAESPVDESYIVSSLECAVAFCSACDQYFTELVGDCPYYSQSGMNTWSFRKAQELRNQLASKLCVIRANIAAGHLEMVTDLKRLGREQMLWSSYYKKRLSIVQDAYEGGSILPLMVNTEATSLLEVRLKEVEAFTKVNQEA